MSNEHRSVPSPSGIPSPTITNESDNPNRSCASPNLTEVTLIQRRAALIQSNAREATGRAMCAICGDPCIQPKTSPVKLNLETDSLSEMNDPLKKNSVSGDTKEKQAMAQRLVRFGGMLVCTTCIEIQAADL
ncbi:unnamed protein product [Echinostoma caproni]|uniref:ClpX-type ZB domain-containing protein n=1 Tax=Echinostoma caproni TaxID=27848 RepID=A0A183ARY5_9TREM|nr:unnamed protein product [Echinostoma caproni]